ncbi:TadE family type IV pilus minor pilin [Streptomyces sp. FL07-04A]|nr:TadE family type IV pilus minor pilin [Streptomyces sp. FL07-04A]
MTAESAVVLPVLVVFAMSLVWGLLAVSAQIQCVDAARAGARAAARRDPDAAVLEVARATAPRGARVTVGREGDQVRVVVVAKPPGLRGLPFEVREEAVAAAEDTVGEQGGAEDPGGRGGRGGTGNAGDGPGDTGSAADGHGEAPGAETAS